jgi:hypothetical protein
LRFLTLRCCGPLLLVSACSRNPSAVQSSGSATTISATASPSHTADPPTAPAGTSLTSPSARGTVRPGPVSVCASSIWFASRRAMTPHSQCKKRMTTPRLLQIRLKMMGCACLNSSTFVSAASSCLAMCGRRSRMTMMAIFTPMLRMRRTCPICRARGPRRRTRSRPSCRRPAALRDRTFCPAQP